MIMGRLCAYVCDVNCKFIVRLRYRTIIKTELLPIERGSRPCLPHLVEFEDDLSHTGVDV